ncbi:MAG TPA: T9SS type A sorting domain-containing protein, partial [Saprospiraceae bacterium]|nr:T9SS type A sorting domain-containing protein [Saprospiraceae bacterium]
GAFMFDQLDMGAAFELSPVKNDDPLNGISTIDLILIQNHILGKKILNSPYKIIAADLDGSKKITATDIVLLKKLILHMISEIPGQNSWKFIDKNYQFPNPYNPWQEDFPVKFVDNHLMEDKPTVDFIGIKMGDVNNNAVNKLSGENEVRTQHDIIPISFEDKAFKEGELVTCQLNLATPDQLTALQFSLDINTDKAELIRFDPDFRNNISENDLYYDINSKKLHFSWFKTEGAGFVEETNIVNLQFRALKEGNLSDLLKICDKDNKPEALTIGQDIKTPVLQAILPGSLTPKFTLFQNKPNPFSKNTVISFNLPEPGNAIVRVMDVTGKVIYTTTQQYSQGYQEVNIDSNQLSGPGVYIYSVETAKNTAMARMILLQ